jgi:hypothetical protein
MAGYGLALAYLAHHAAHFAGRRLTGPASGASEVMAVLAVAGVGFLALDKAQGLDRVQPLSTFTSSVRAYLAGGVYGIPLGRTEAFELEQRNNQLLIVTDGRNPIFYQHAYSALGFVRFVTGKTDIMGWSGEAADCADPFAAWGGDWQMGPIGFNTALPVRAVGFNARYGRGTELSYLLSAPQGALQTESGPAPWRLYQINSGPPAEVATGAGPDALRATLQARSLTPEAVALNCGLQM